MAKAIRTQTDLGKNPISMAYVIVQMAKKLFADLTQSKVMLVGVVR